MELGRKHRSTLEANFAEPIRASVAWREIESLLVACGGEISEGQGSRVRVALNGVRAVFHRPHPQKETDKGALKSVRRFPGRSGDCAMNTMTHKGYEAIVEYDEDADLFHGEIMNTRDVITFQGRSVDELKTAFAQSVEDYLAFCRERGEEPEKPFSGQFVVRVDPVLHRMLAVAAKRAGTSLNKWVAATLKRAAAR
jgi:predicted HicB family RNase H-like nuclease